MYELLVIINVFCLCHVNIRVVRTVYHRPHTRCAKLRVVYAPGMSGTFSVPPRVSDPDIHQGTHVPWCLPGSLTSDFLWSQWRGKRSRHSRCMRKQQFSVFGKRPIVVLFKKLYSRLCLDNLFSVIPFSTDSSWPTATWIMPLDSITIIGKSWKTPATYPSSRLCIWYNGGPWSNWYEHSFETMKHMLTSINTFVNTSLIFVSAWP